MSSEAVRAALDRLKIAGKSLRARPASELVEALGNVLESFGNETSPWRQRLVKEHAAAAGFSERTVDAGLRLALREWNRVALASLLEDELPDPENVRGFDTSAIVLGGALPMPSLIALLAPLLVRSAVLVKTASRDPVTAGLFRECLAEVDAELAACVEVVSFASSDEACTQALFEANLLSATGSDETLRTLRTRFGNEKPFVGYGHKLSISLLGSEGLEDPAVCEGLAFDVAMWDQLGCLSPIACYVLSEDDAAVDAFARRVAEQLQLAESRWPRGELSLAAARAVSQERSQAELRAASGLRTRLFGDDELKWTVVREDDASMRAAPLHRFLRIHPVGSESQLFEALTPLAAHLAGVAIAGCGASNESLRERLLALGASRVCEFGSLQAPPLAWDRDGRGVLKPFLSD